MTKKNLQRETTGEEPKSSFSWSWRTPSEHARLLNYVNFFVIFFIRIDLTNGASYEILED